MKGGGAYEGTGLRSRSLPIYPFELLRQKTQCNMQSAQVPPWLLAWQTRTAASVEAATVDSPLPVRVQGVQSLGRRNCSLLTVLQW